MPIAEINTRLTPELAKNLDKKPAYITNKRRGIGQYPIFSRAPYLYAKKHTTFVIKVEVWGKRLFFFAIHAAH